jgi:hypothetical protein
VVVINELHRLADQLTGLSWPGNLRAIADQKLHSIMLWWVGHQDDRDYHDHVYGHYHHDSNRHHHKKLRGLSRPGNLRAIADQKLHSIMLWLVLVRGGGGDDVVVDAAAAAAAPAAVVDEGDD